MLSPFLILMIVALICFFSAAIGGTFWHPDTRPYAIGWLGAFFACIALLVK